MRISEAILLMLALGLATPITAAAETRTVADGLEVHVTVPILRSETPQYIETDERCAAPQPGWHIVPGSVKSEVVVARLMDPGGDPDWKVEKAEARTRLADDGAKVCLRGYCQGPYLFQCEIDVKAGWQEER